MLRGVAHLPGPVYRVGTSNSGICLPIVMCSNHAVTVALLKPFQVSVFLNEEASNRVNTDWF